MTSSSRSRKRRASPVVKSHTACALASPLQSSIMSLGVGALRRDAALGAPAVSLHEIVRTFRPHGERLYGLFMKRIERLLFQLQETAGPHHGDFARAGQVDVHDSLHAGGSIGQN